MDESSPIVGPVAHVYVEASPGVCFCGRARFTGVHVADCGHVELPLQAIRERLDQIERLAGEVDGLLSGAMPR